MKRIIVNISVAVAAGALFCSCLQDVEPTAYLSETRRGEIIQEDTAKVFYATLVGMYSDIQSACQTDLQHNYFGQKSFDYLTSLMGNDMVMTGQYGMSLYHYLLDYWQQNYAPTSNRWSEYYTHIANANYIIKNVDIATATSETKGFYAQALAFRGYAYLHLSYLYQRPYYVGADGTKWGKGDVYDWSQKPCVPLVLEDSEGGQPRSTVEQVTAQIISDFEQAYSLFAEIGAVKTVTPTDFDGCVVANYLARTYMIKHDWANALKYAQVVIDNFSYLTSEDDILQGFSTLSLPDVLFGCDITADNTGIYRSFFSQMGFCSDGYAGIGVWRVGFKPFVDGIADDDIRLHWFITPGSMELADYAAAYYQSTKFIGQGRDKIDKEGWELGDYIYLRSEEAYFMKAEILAHQDKLSEAAAVLTDIMKSRQPSYECTATSKADIIEEINYQKRVEFWGEGIEYLDNRRLNIPVDRTDKTWGAANNNHYPAAKFYADQEDEVFAYQLPIKEIESNPALTEKDQN